MEDIGWLHRSSSRLRGPWIGAIVLCVAIAGAASSAAAQFGSTAEVARPIPATNPLDPTAAGSEVVIKNRIVAQTTDQLLQEAAGTRVVSTGALGTPFCLRVRGSACEQVAVLLGDIPISSPDTGDFDLSLVPLEALSGFEVYRGGTPAWLNNGSIGGVLRLQPRAYENNEVGARGTLGSFGAWRANVFGAGAGEKASFFGTAGAAGARNDYPYLDDNNTLLIPTDDVERRRQNADFLEGFGFGNLRLETSDKSNLDLVFLGLGRERGEPGPAASRSLQARVNETRLIGSAAWLQEERGKHPYRLQVAANYDFGGNRVDDELGEVGLPRRTDNKTHAVFGRVAASVITVPWLEVTTVAAARYQAFDPKNELSTAQQPASDRVTAAGTVEARFFGNPGDVGLELRPSVRLSWTRARIRQSVLGGTPPPERSDFLPTFRVGGAIAPLEWLAFRGSFASGYKLPSVLQLFGDQARVSESIDLIPEQSLAIDGAVTVRGTWKLVSGYASVGAFVTYIDNMIRPRIVSQNMLKYENIDSARNRGVEIELRGGVTERFFITGEMTWVQAIDQRLGRQLPGQPEWVAFAQPEVHSGTLSKIVSDLLVFFQVWYVGKSFNDPANLVEIPGRTVLALGAGADLFEGRLGLSFRVDDLLDVRGVDILSFPLPGRRYTGRLTVRHEW